VSHDCYYSATIESVINSVYRLVEAGWWAYHRSGISCFAHMPCTCSTRRNCAVPSSDEMSVCEDNRRLHLQFDIWTCRETLGRPLKGTMVETRAVWVPRIRKRQSKDERANLRKIPSKRFKRGKDDLKLVRSRVIGWKQDTRYIRVMLCILRAQ
jgi:hypothetical protein